MKDPNFTRLVIKGPCEWPSGKPKGPDQIVWVNTKYITQIRNYAGDRYCHVYVDTGGGERATYFVRSTPEEVLSGAA